MRYFLDTEFTERPGFMQLISIGIVREDGRAFYAENTSFDEREANDWVKENVLGKLRYWTSDGLDCPKPFVHTEKNNSIEMLGTISSIKKVLLGFFYGDPSPEFWAYFADYDWVNFCWIFGEMIDLPKGFPYYCKDLKQSLDEAGLEKIPDPEEEHNALVDALWNKDLHDYIVNNGNGDAK